MQDRESDEEERLELVKKVDKMEVMLKQVANVLASSTNYATMVSAPQYKNTKLKFVQLSQVDEYSLLAVIVADGNVVKNQIIDVEKPLANDEVLKLNVLLNSFLQGLTLKEINLELIQTMKDQAGIHSQILERILEEIAVVIHNADQLEIYTGGASNILKYPELGSPETATELLDALVEKKALNKLVGDTLESDDHHGIQVYIGDEAPVKNMSDCSIVTATYELEEGGTGTIGIIGPKRMDYKRVVKTLQNLTDEINDLFKKNIGGKVHYGRREKVQEEEMKENTVTEEKETEKAKDTKKADKKASKKQKADDLVKEKDQQIEELTDKYQRLMAEFENVRKRTAKEFVQRYDMGAMGVLENFFRSLIILSGAFSRGGRRKRFSVCSGHRTDL